MKIIALLAMGLIAALMTEITAIGWMTTGPIGLDLLGNYYLGAFTPAAVIATTLSALVLKNRIAAQPLLATALFGGAYLTGEFAITQAMSSPIGETLVCEAIVIAVTVTIFALTARLQKPAST